MIEPIISPWLILIIPLFFFSWARTILESLYILQLKEYRWDRFKADVLAADFLFGNRWMVKFLLFCLVYSLGLLWFNFYGYIFFILIYSVDLTNWILNIKRRLLYRPTFTKKILSLLVFVIFFSFGFVILFGVENYLNLLIMELFIPILLCFLVIFIWPFSYLLKKIVVLKARRKIKQFSNLKIIGVTGSFGKSTTKYFLEQILGSKFKTLATKGNINTEIGVAQTINTSLNKDIEVFIVEMGAYKKGEIAAICDLVSPHIGVLTAIGNQHLALFGSPENIISAKFELIDSLNSNGLAVLNFDSLPIRDNLNKVNCHKIIYSVKEKADLVAQNIKQVGLKVKFDLLYQNNTYPITLNLIGTHNVSNLLGAILVALELKMSFPEIVEAVNRILPREHNLSYKINNSGLILIDDTYNANVSGMISAISDLKNFSGKKMVVLSSLLELGESTFMSEEEVGKIAGKVADFIMVASPLSFKNYLASITSVNFPLEKFSHPLEIDDFKKFVNKNLNKDDVVLFLGRSAQKYFSALNK